MSPETFNAETSRRGPFDPPNPSPQRRSLGPIREWVARVPTAGWICALVALLNAITWSVIVPLFQVPDEQDHVAYAQYLAETGSPPSGRNDRASLSQEERVLLHGLAWRQITHRPDNRPLGSAFAHRRLENAVAAPADRTGGGGYNKASSQPPLYYALAAAAYRLSPSTSLANRVHLMRLVSAALAAVTVLLIFLFLRELLPGTPWAWPVGALAVAFQPMFGFIAGGVNDDNLLFAAAAGLFLGFALSFRRGLTAQRGVAIGASAAVGVLAKITMLGMLPAAALGLLLLIHGSPSGRRQEAMRGALMAVATAAIPVFVYMLLNTTVWDRGLFLGANGSIAVQEAQRGIPVIPHPASFGDALGYLWQFYLPRLPSMHPQFDAYQLRAVWFHGFIGRFGWLDYDLPSQAYTFATCVAVAIVVLAGRELFAHRWRVRTRLSELITYVALMVCLLAFVNIAGYYGRLSNPSGFEQGRYLFPLLALYAGLVALAARGAGRRYGPAVGVFLVSLAVAHSVVAMLVTLTRYYG